MSCGMMPQKTQRLGLITFSVLSLVNGTVSYEYVFSQQINQMKIYEHPLTIIPSYIKFLKLLHDYFQWFYCNKKSKTIFWVWLLIKLYGLHYMAI